MFSPCRTEPQERPATVQHELMERDSNTRNDRLVDAPMLQPAAAIVLELVRLLHSWPSVAAMERDPRGSPDQLGREKEYDSRFLP